MISTNARGRRIAAFAPQIAQFWRWFGSSATVDKSGRPLVLFHGTARPDRIGARFRRTRATSGPQAFFTDDPEIASQYEVNKSDTSIHYEDDDPNYQRIVVFVHDPKHWQTSQSTPLRDIWNRLTEADRERIRVLAPRIRLDDDNNVIVDPMSKAGPGSLDYEIQRARGNVFHALVESWLASGYLHNMEHLFLEVTKLLGLKQIYIRTDADSYASVFPVYLRIHNPLVTTQIPDHVLAALARASGRGSHTPPVRGADPWDKRVVNAAGWIKALSDDVASRRSSLAWTSIPDWVTKTLIRLGYDGIKDQGGKLAALAATAAGKGISAQSVAGHTVWVPFYDRQIKSATGNVGDFSHKPGLRNPPVSNNPPKPMMESIAVLGFDLIRNGHQIVLPAITGANAHFTNIKEAEIAYANIIAGAIVEKKRHPNEMGIRILNAVVKNVFKNIRHYQQYVAEIARGSNIS